MKNWIDTVLTKGWAYGPGGTALQDKSLVQVISSGGPEMVCQRGGYNNFTLAELLRPFKQTADLCGMRYHQPFLTQGVGTLDDDAIKARAARYHRWLQAMVNGDLPPDVNSMHVSQAEFLSTAVHL